MLVNAFYLFALITNVKGGGGRRGKPCKGSEVDANVGCECRCTTPTAGSSSSTTTTTITPPIVMPSDCKAAGGRRNIKSCTCVDATTWTAPWADKACSTAIPGTESSDSSDEAEPCETADGVDTCTCKKNTPAETPVTAADCDAAGRGKNLMSCLCNNGSTWAEKACAGPGIDATAGCTCPDGTTVTPNDKGGVWGKCGYKTRPTSCTCADGSIWAGDYMTTPTTPAPTDIPA